MSPLPYVILCFIGNRAVKKHVFSLWFLLLKKDKSHVSGDKASVDTTTCGLNRKGERELLH